MKKILFLLPVLFSLASCDLFNNFGKKVDFGESQVYYKGDGVTEKDAKKLGDYLKKQQYFDNETPKSVQITHDEDDYLVHFVVDEDKLTDAARFNFWKYQHDISNAVFGGDPVRIVLADNELEDIEILNPIALHKGGKSTIYYDNSEIRKTDAKKLMEFLVEQKLMGEAKTSDAFYQKEDGTPIVRLIVDPKKVTEASLTAFSYFQTLMREQLFNTNKAKLLLTSTSYEDLAALPKLTAEQRQAFDNELNQRTDQNTETVMDSTLTQTTTSGVLRLPND